MSFFAGGEDQIETGAGRGQGFHTRRVRVTRFTIWIIGVVNLLTKSPDPPSSS